jgi:hypothetical protein
LTATEHFNACLRLPTTRWTWMIHDDDELCPGAIDTMAGFIEQCPDVGLVMGGAESIYEHGDPFYTWLPKSGGAFHGEEALLRLGLDFGAFSPSTIFNTEATRQVGGFVEIDGYPADYAFCVRLAHASGIAFWPGVVGLYRHGRHQDTDFSTAEKAEAWLAFSVRMVEEVVRQTKCSTSAEQQLIDYMTWSVFKTVIFPWFDVDPFFVFRVCRERMAASPPDGTYRGSVQQEFPFLFSRRWPVWALARRVKTTLRTPLRKWRREPRPAGRLTSGRPES